MKKENHFLKWMLKIIFLYAFLTFIGTLAVNAQEREVTGTVTTEEGVTLPGANVLIKGTTTGTITDIDGNYTLPVPDADAILVFSFMGYQTQEVPLAGRTVINTILLESAATMDEVVMIGYGTQRKRELTSSVASLSGEETTKQLYSNVTQSIQGKMTGVNVESDGGIPGQDVKIIIRGAGTLTNANPLFVIDGVFTESMSTVNPEDIESIEVLKDASAAAIYGSRAANGVILITTKRGQKGKIKVDFNASTGWQSPTRLLDLVDARTYADLANMASDNDGTARYPANDTQFDPTVNTDWDDLLYRTAPISRYNLAFSGGTEDLTYNMSAGYVDQTGILFSTDSKQYNFRINSAITKNKFKLSESFSYARNVLNRTSFWGFRGNVPSPTYDPFRTGYDPKNPDGSHGYQGYDVSFHGPQPNRHEYALDMITDNERITSNILGNINGEYEIIKGLKYKLNLGLSHISYFSYSFTPAFDFGGSSYENKNPSSELSESRLEGYTLLAENTLNYRNTFFGNHAIDLLAGYTTQKGYSRSLSGSGNDTPNDDIRVLSGTTTDSQRANSSENVNGLRSYFGRINYNFKGKYLLSASVRRDGSSRFNEDNRWGTFPSVSAGWMISDETFFERINFVSNFKIRASYGVLGSQNLGNYDYSPVLGLGPTYYFGDPATRLSGVALTDFVSEDIIWETTKISDIGLDLSLFENRIFFVADYFIKNSEDILIKIPLPQSAGAIGAPTVNAASIENKGLELELIYKKGEGDFKYDIGIFTSFLNNKVTSLGESGAPIVGLPMDHFENRASLTRAGDPVGMLYGYVVDGIFQSQAEIDAWGLQPTARPGDFKYADTNNDGVLNNEDRTNIGNPIPELELGVNFNASYKNFDLYVFLNGAFGHEIYNAAKSWYTFFNYTYTEDALNAWTPSNTDTDHPRLTFLDPNYNIKPSDWMVESGSYLRINTVQIGYSLPGNLLAKLKMEKLRVFISGQNLHVFSNYTGMDPETGSATRRLNTGTTNNLLNRGVDMNPLPRPRVISVGLQTTF